MGIRRGRTAVAIVFAAAVITGCGGGDDSTTSTEDTTELNAVDDTTTTTAAPTTTSTTLSPEQLAAQEVAADTQLILQMWRGMSDAWGLGNEAGMATGFQAIVDNSYPGSISAVDGADCRRQAEAGFAPFTRYQEETIVNAATVARDDGWVSPVGPLTGQVPNGRIYIYQATTVYTVDNQPADEELAEIHAAIVDGRAFMFFSCER